jgi:hypothetical protein
VTLENLKKIISITLEKKLQKYFPPSLKEYSKGLALVF